MSKLYQPFLNLAPRLIGLAKTVTFTYRTAGAYDATAGTVAVTESSVTTKAVVEDFDEPEVSDTVQSGDIKLTVATKGFTLPEVDDTVTIDGDEYRIVAIEHIMVGLQPVAHQLQARR